MVRAWDGTPVTALPDVERTLVRRQDTGRSRLSYRKRARAASGAPAGKGRCRGPAPRRRLRCALEHTREPRIVDVGEPECHGIGPGALGQRVHGRFDGQRVRPGPQASPGTAQDRQAHQVEFDAPVSDPVRRHCAARDAVVADKVGQALHPGCQYGVGEQNVAGYEAMPPLVDATVYQPGADAVAGGGPVKAVLELLGPRPLHLDCASHGARQHGGLQLHRAQGLAAEGAADP